MKNKQSGFVIPLVIIIIILAIITGIYLRNQALDSLSTKIPNATTTPVNIVGNDKDIHGCIGSAGYTWCQIKNKCLRVWEEKCKIIATSTIIISTTTTVTQIPAKTTPSFSLADVAKHNNNSSCWTAIDGKVYDITKYIPIHPAGVSKALEGCGIDSTDIFNNVRAHRVSGISKYLIGNLK